MHHFRVFVNIGGGVIHLVIVPHFQEYTGASFRKACQYDHYMNISWHLNIILNVFLVTIIFDREIKKESTRTLAGVLLFTTAITVGGLITYNSIHHVVVYLLCVVDMGGLITYNTIHHVVYLNNSIHMIELDRIMQRNRARQPNKMNFMYVRTTAILEGDTTYNIQYAVICLIAVR
ncbi:hypothetical protein ACJX0J_005613, partial [Zea mays]